MSVSLVVSQPRRLALPDACLFAPTELSIPDSLSQADFQKLGTALCKVDSASDLWVCDYIAHGIRQWADAGLALSKAATGYTKGTCKKLAYIAQRFTPEHRPAGFTRAHFKGLLPFPQDWLNTWLPTVSVRVSSNGIRALAD